MKSITEEMKEHEKWYEDARKMTLSQLAEFINHLTNDYKHDYGTIVHAMTAGALASISVIDRSPEGGITGFQASCIMWQFIKTFMHIESPLRLLNFEDLLYPQYENTFRTISEDTWKWVQDKAKQNLIEHTNAANTVKTHWQSIVDGYIPFGYMIEKKESLNE